MEYKNREEYDKSKVYFTHDNCPFCDKDLSKKNKILYISDFWIVVYNKYPYFEDNINLLVFPKRHIEFTIGLNENELIDFLNVEKFIKEFYKNEEYFSFIRQTKSNKSVEHLHYHYLKWYPSARVIDRENYFKIKN